MKISNPLKRGRPTLDVETAQGRLIGQCLSLTTPSERAAWDPDREVCAIASRGVALDLSDRFSQHLLEMMSVQDDSKRGCAAILACAVMEASTEVEEQGNVSALATLGAFAAWQIGDPLLPLVLLGTISRRFGITSQIQADLLNSVVVPGTAKQWRDWHAAHPEVKFGGSHGQD